MFSRMSANNEANKDLEAGNGEAQPPTGTYNTKRMQMAQAQVNEVIDVMRVSLIWIVETYNRLRLN